MNMLIAWLVSAALFLALIGVIYAALRDRKASRNEIKRLTAELEAQKRINEELLNYTKEIAKINGDKDNVAEQIKEAENDEEVMAIIAGLVRTNNDRVRK